ncbi:methyltransferase domain-domain-containing protein [Clohesyomyces aquaticus]|uniref:Methyltransferase domain-domain-containing protein n=1 Tax=Clohesyomyces aquaticus TaxID=1231657 RepID=A0A1Y2A9Z5_9PLEO|nr:methyltransferase domain-domain-containing protein [Clohesyomyces aquaticus]
MRPNSPLPFATDFCNVDEYVESLLQFATSSWLLQTLCGGVHILDFYTREPDLYATILPEDWSTWFKGRDIMDILDLLMREDLSQFHMGSEKTSSTQWRGGPIPPRGLLLYLREVRMHLLGRNFPSSSEKSSIARHIALGMKVKKVHEVDNFARYVDQLTAEVATARQEEITHLVDFGSGQNYLGRALAALPYSKHVIAVESRPHNIEGAKNMDVLAKLVPKPLVMRNKKEYRAKMGREKNGSRSEKMVEGAQTQHETCDTDGCTQTPPLCKPDSDPSAETKVENSQSGPTDDSYTTESQTLAEADRTATTTLQIYTEGQGSVQYVEHRIKDGDLAPVISQILDSTQVQHSNGTAPLNPVEEASNLNVIPKSAKPNLMVISLHSCGNLVHHGLRSLLLNPSISAVAMVGCCYNLVTERLGPPTYKLPTLRPNHPRLLSTSNACDPHGFPMSERMATYPLPLTPPSSNDSTSSPSETPKGIRLNITARMMGVQAPQNWGRDDSDLFFTRHFYRALLQRIFLDRGVVSAPADPDDIVGGPVSAAGHTSKVNWTPPDGRGPGLSSNGSTTPLTIGTLRKFAYSDFVSYVRAAVGKLTSPNSFCEVDPGFIAEKMGGLTDEEIRGYEERFKEKKKELSVMWSLMAFSAGVVEAIIVTDRWLWLREQEEVGDAWVEPVFEYKMSPRNLVVVGIKK